MTRKLFVLLALVALALAVVACGGAATPAADTDPQVADETAVVAPEEPTEAPMEATEMPPATEATEEPAAAEEPVAPADGDLGTADNPIIMSFVPSGDTEDIAVSGDDIAAMLSEQTGLEIEANVATSYAAVVEAMGAGNAHVGWLNTFGYVLASERYGVDVSLATLRFGIPYYTGQIIANADSGVAELADIPGHTVCWGDPLSTSGYIIPSIVLRAEGIDVDALDAQHLGGHSDVVTAVYQGDCDVGATFVDARTTIAEEHPDVNDKVIVIAETTEIPNDTVAFAEGVPDDVRQQVVDALLAVADTEEGAAALEQVYEIEGLQEVDDSFYDSFRADLDAAGVNIEDYIQD